MAFEESDGGELRRLRKATEHLANQSELIAQHLGTMADAAVIISCWPTVEDIDEGNDDLHHHN